MLIPCHNTMHVLHSALRVLNIKKNRHLSPAIASEMFSRGQFTTINPIFIENPILE